MFEHTERCNDREFFRRVLPDLTSGKKVIVQNKFSVKNATSTLIRYVAYNSIDSLI